jgi:hypothetical protein
MRRYRRPVRPSPRIVYAKWHGEAAAAAIARASAEGAFKKDEKICGVERAHWRYSS